MRLGLLVLGKDRLALKLIVRINLGVSGGREEVQFRAA